MGCQRGLVFHMDIGTGVVDKEGTALEHVCIRCLSISSVQTSKCGSNKMINGHFLTREELVLSETARGWYNARVSPLTWNRATVGFGILACSTFWRRGELGNLTVEDFRTLAFGKDSTAHEELNCCKAHVSKPLMPSKPLPLSVRQVQIGIRNFTNNTMEPRGDRSVVIGMLSF